MKKWLSIVLVSTLATVAHATGEICGNGIDDDGNGMTDEGCYPTMTTGVCESPLSCSDTGMVSWSTGSLHYDVPPDIAPLVPYGPGIGFRRFYTSMYSPTGANPTSVNHAPMGPGWQHTYMTWVYPYTVSSTNDHIIYHTSQGRDVLYTKTSSDATYNYYTPQTGEHVLSMKLRISDSYVFLQVLTGETFVFNGVGQIIEIWDTVSPTPNKVLITWTSTSNGSVSKVLDASGNRQLIFNYTNNLLTSINFQVQITSGSFITQHTTTYDYSNNVSRDATSGFFVPANYGEWTNLLQGTDVPIPTNIWQLQETSGNLADSGAGVFLTAHAGTGLTYHTAVSGWSRSGISFTDGSTSYFTSSSLCNPKTTSCSSMALVALNSTPASERQIMVNGDNNGNKSTVAHQTVPTTGNYIRDYWNASASYGQGAHATSTGSVVPLILSTSPSTSSTFARAGIDAFAPTWAAGTSASDTYTLGGSGNGAPMTYVYAAYWQSAALTGTQAATLRSKVTIGPGILTTVTIGGQLAQQHTYSNGYLTKITDGAGAQIAELAYSSTTPGQVAHITTARGSVAFEFASTRTSCSGKTLIAFNSTPGTGTGSTCRLDSDCSSGSMCSSGRCYSAGRCLTTSSTSGETFVTDVAPVAGSGTCDGACTDVMQYTWPALATNVISPIALKDPLSNYTSITYNWNGLPTQIGYGDTDTDPTNGGTNRTVYYIYDTTYPGRIAEVRRPSDLSTGCSAASPTGCKRTIYGYGTDQQVQTVTESGYTLSATNTVTTYSNITTYTHDTSGRITEIDGPVSGIKTTFDFYPSGFTTPLASGFLQDSKSYTDATHYLEPQLSNYDLWGHPTSLQDPNGNFTCDTYDTARGTITQRRRAMAGQTSCTTTNSADLIVGWTRDTGQRLVMLQRQDSGCEVYGYDSLGRISSIRRDDSCGFTGTGDTKVFIYVNPTTLQANEQAVEIDTKDSSGTIKKKELFSYYASRKLQKVFNPASPTNFTNYTYDAAGNTQYIDGEGNLSRTVNHYDATTAPGRDNRITSVEEYKTSSTSDTWSLLYAWDGAQTQVTDGDSKVTGSARDDLGRIVRLSSPDFTGNTIRVYDAASNLASVIEDQGGTGQQTHTFTYDYLNRRLTDDYYGTCSVSGAGVAHAEIQRYHDSLPTGVSCPLTSCSNTKGKLAYVVTTLMCSSTYATTDGALDQQTWFAYDAAGHVIEEYTTDDTGRSADTSYQYTKGMLSRVGLPSGHPIAWVYGGLSGNSDNDVVSDIKYNNTETIVDQVQWNPFGPWSQYNWQASIGGTALRSRVVRDLAYRTIGVYEAEYQSGTFSNDQIAIGRDAMGRVTSRAYSPHDPSLPGLYDSYILYDEQSRVICETTSLGRANG